MDVAVLVYDGVFDSGLAAILDVLDGANAMGGELSDPPSWNVTKIGFRPQVTTGAGHLVATQPVERAATADLLIVPALAERRPEALLAHVAGPPSLPARDLIAQTYGQNTLIASACTGTFLLAESGILDGLRNRMGKLTP